MPLVTAVFRRLVVGTGMIAGFFSGFLWPCCLFCLSFGVSKWVRGAESHSSTTRAAQSLTLYTERVQCQHCPGPRQGSYPWDPCSFLLGCCDPSGAAAASAGHWWFSLNIQSSSAGARPGSGYRICLFCARGHSVCRARLKLTRLRCFAQGPECSSSAPTWPTSPLWLLFPVVPSLGEAAAVQTRSLSWPWVRRELRAQLRALKCFWFTSADTKYTAGEHLPTGSTVQGL